MPSQINSSSFTLRKFVGAVYLLVVGSLFALFADNSTPMHELFKSWWNISQLQAKAMAYVFWGLMLVVDGLAIWGLVQLWEKSTKTSNKPYASYGSFLLIAFVALNLFVISVALPEEPKTPIVAVIEEVIEEVIEDVNPPPKVVEPVATEVPNIIFEDDFCDGDTPHWATWNYTDIWAEWTPEFQELEEGCRLYLEAKMQRNDIGWYRLYENAINAEVGNLRLTDFNLSVYTKMLDAPNPDNTLISIHFRIGRPEENYHNYWIWINNNHEYCVAVRTADIGGECIPTEIDGETFAWIKDDSISPLGDGNKIRLQVYGSEIRVFFANNDETEARGSPFKADLITSSGGLAFGIRPLAGDTVRIEYRDLVIYEEIR